MVCFLHISSKKKFPNLPNVPCHALDMGFYHHAKTWNKTLNAQIEGRKEEDILSKEFVNVCDWFVENNLPLRFGQQIISSFWWR